MTDCPYVGLRPFEAADRARFFGREGDAARLQNALFAHPLTVLYAVSGTGKSSVVRTLVIPYLQSTGAQVIEIADWPGDQAPLATVRAALGVAADTPLDAVLATDDDTERVLILDQFEELLAHDDRRAGVRDLMRTFARIGRNAPDTFILVAIREEQIGRLRDFAGRYADVLRNTYAMSHLDPAGVRDAIERPAADAGRPMEPALVERLITDLADRGAPVQLPLLQVVCRWLWHASAGDTRIRLQHYTAAGGRDGVIRAWLDATLGAFTGSRDAVAAVLDFLAPQSGYKQAYSVDELIAQTRDRAAAPAPDAIRAAVAHLRAADVVHAVDQAGVARFQLRHDAFIGLLQGWLEAAREARLKARARRLRMWTIGLAIVAVALVVGAIYIGVQRAEIREQRGVITQQKANLARQQTALDTQRAQLDRQRIQLDARQRQLEAIRESEVECLLTDAGCSDVLIGAWTPEQLAWVWAFVEAKHPRAAGLAAIRPASDDDSATQHANEARQTFVRAQLAQLRGGTLADSLRPAALIPDAAFYATLQRGATWANPRQSEAVAFAAGLYEVVRGRPLRAAALFEANGQITSPRLSFARGYALLRACEADPGPDIGRQAKLAFDLLTSDAVRGAHPGPERAALAGYAGALALDRGAAVPIAAITDLLDAALTGFDAAKDPTRARLVSLLHARAQLAQATRSGVAAPLLPASERLEARVKGGDLATLFGPRRLHAHRAEEALVLGILAHERARLSTADARVDALSDAEFAFGEEVSAHSSPHGRVAFARLYSEQGNFTDADAQLSKALKLERAFGPAYVLRVQIQLWSTLGKVEIAQATSDAACAYADDYTCHLTRAMLAADAGDWDRAHAALDRAERVGLSQRDLWRGASDAQLIAWLRAKRRPTSSDLARLCPGPPRCP